MSNAETLTPFDTAREILGSDFISPEEIMVASHSVIYTDEQLAQFKDTVPPEEMLQWCRDNNMMLVSGPNRPLSTIEIRDLQSDYFYSKKGGWYALGDFAHNDKADTRWIMLRKEPVPKSTSKNWNEQQLLLSETEVMPNLAEVTWCMTTYKAVRDIYLLVDFYVRTSSLTSDGFRVLVGRFGAKGLLVDGWHNDVRYSDLGVSTSRKF